MRTALKNKQRLKYALYNERQPVYELDSDGNPLYTEIDGQQVPVLAGYDERFYSEPVDFIGNIMPVGSESYARGNVAKYLPFGIDVSAYDALILMNRGEVPLTESSLIWYDTTPTQREAVDTFIDDESYEAILDGGTEGIEPSDGTITVWDETTADYMVKRVASSQNITLYLLQRMNHNGTA